MTTDVGSIRYDITADTSDVSRATDEVDRFGQAARRTGEYTDEASVKNTRMQNQFRKTATQSRRLRGAFGQLGFQIQDVAVQLQSGTNAAQVFGQQGSQIAAIFGPGGAVIGALIAVGAALVGTYVTSLNEGEEATKSLSERVDDLALSYDELTAAQRDAIALEMAKAAMESERAIAAQRQELENLTDTQRNLQRLQEMGENDDALGDVFNADQLVEVNEQITKLEADIDTALQELKKDQEEYQDVLSGTTEETDEAADKLAKFAEQLQIQADTQALSNEELVKYEFARLSANVADKEAISNAEEIVMSSLEKIEAYRKEQQALEALKASTKITEGEDPMLQRIEAQERGEQRITEIQKRETAERLAAAREANELMGADFMTVSENIGMAFENLSTEQQAAFNAMGGVMGNLKDIMAQGGEESFQAYKRLAQAEAAIAGSLAVIKALGSAPPPFNFALATTIGALTAVNIAAIDQQEYQGARKDGGGVSSGRSYLVGEEGPEILQMGSQSGFITPNDKMGGGGVVQNINLNVSGDVTAQTRREIVRAIPLIREQARKSVLTATQEGGAMSRAVGRKR